MTQLSIRARLILTRLVANPELNSPIVRGVVSAKTPEKPPAPGKPPPPGKDKGKPAGGKPAGGDKGKKQDTGATKPSPSPGSKPGGKKH